LLTVLTATRSGCDSMPSTGKAASAFVKVLADRELASRVKLRHHLS
jgi:hypothetical protein